MANYLQFDLDTSDAHAEPGGVYGRVLDIVRPTLTNSNHAEVS
jgi:hypothetical protein